MPVARRAQHQRLEEETIQLRAYKKASETGSDRRREAQQRQLIASLQSRVCQLLEEGCNARPRDQRQQQQQQQQQRQQQQQHEALQPPGRFAPSPPPPPPPATQPTAAAARKLSDSPVVAEADGVKGTLRKLRVRGELIGHW